MATSGTNSTQSTLEELVATAQAAVAQSVEASKKKQENAAKAESIAAEVSSTLKTISGDVAIVTATQNAAQLKMQAQNSQIARAAGIDPETGANILVDTVTKLRKSNAETEAALNDYRKKNETSFLDNPIDWVVAQVTLPMAEAKLEGAAKSSALYADQLTKVNQTLQNSFQTTEKLKESMTTASAESATRVAAATTLIESQKYALESLKYNTQGIQEAQNATQEQLSYLYNSFNAQKAEQQLKLAQESGALARARFDFEKTFRQDQLDAKKEGKVLDEVVKAKFNAGRAALGMKPLEGPEALFALNKMKTGAGGDVQTYYEIGDKLMSTGTGYLGNTPAEAVKTLQTTPNNLPDIKKETKALLEAALGALQQAKNIDHKDKIAVDGFINKFVNDQIGLQYRSIVPGSDNMFDVGDLSSHLTLPAIKDLPVTQKVLAPLAASGVALNDPKIVLGLLQKSIKDATLTTSEVAGIATVYQKANLINQAARDFKSFGIIPPNAGKNYNAKVSMFGAPLDMTNPSAVQRWIAKEMSNPLVFGESLAPPGIPEGQPSIYAGEDAWKAYREKQANKTKGIP